MTTTQTDTDLLPFTLMSHQRIEKLQTSAHWTKRKGNTHLSSHFQKESRFTECPRAMRSLTFAPMPKWIWKMYRYSALYLVWCWWLKRFLFFSFSLSLSFSLCSFCFIVLFWHISLALASGAEKNSTLPFFFHIYLLILLLFFVKPLSWCWWTY